MGRIVRGSSALAALLLLCAASAGEAQLRPLPPMDWEVFEHGNLVTGRLGGAVFTGQRASLAGTEGRLIEVGEFALAVRSGRIAIEAAGTALRLFDDHSTFADPAGGAYLPTGEQRRDAGDIRFATQVLLTRPDRPASLALRFGTRLPTTDNDVGLERDRTDFFALLAGRLRIQRFYFATEAGVGINGTHDARFEQSDMLMYSAVAGYSLGPVTPRISFVGHMDGMPGYAVRGNEELAEVRVGARFGGRVRAEVDLVYGIETFSPTRGLIIAAGFAL